MINFLDTKSFVRGLKPITSTELVTKTGEFHTEGLFSEIIFGPVESPERRKTFSYIDLHSTVIHPSAYKLLIQLDRKIEKFISSQDNFIVNAEGRLEINEDGVTGITEFIKLFPKIKFRGGTSKRDKFIEKIDKSYKSGLLFLSIVPVIPTDQRPAYFDENGQFVLDVLNEYYLTILRKSFHIKASAKTGPLYDLLNYEIQKSVIDHDNFIRSLIQKKRGLIRSQLLGKRSDFSARAVITPGPDLKVNEIGIPLKLAVSLFEPFLLHRLLKSGKIDKDKLEKEVKNFLGLELTVDSVKKVLKAIKFGDTIPDSLFKLIYDQAEVVMMGRVVLAKRDPALHAESVRAFEPKLIIGNTIQLCTLQCGGFSADFDGDQMAIFHPLTKESQEEAREKMMRAQSAENSSAVTFALSKDMCVGLYMITRDIKTTKSPISVSKVDFEHATDPYIPVVYRGNKTTMGKAIFNSCFPSDFPFYKGQVNKKVINSLIPKCLDRYSQKITIDIFSKLEKFGFKFATIMSPSFSLDMIELPVSIYQLKEKLTDATPEEAAKLIEEMTKILKEHLKGTGLYDLVDSGSTKGWTQPVQMLIAKGIVSDTEGNILKPIKGSFADGLNNEEYFEGAKGARKGIIDRVLNTADTGYMARQLAFILNSVEIHPTLKDCKTTRGLSLRVTKDLLSRLTGRYVIKNGKTELIDMSDYKPGDVITLRTPIYCKSPKLCHTCYGKLLERSRSPYAGVIAAQIIGERGTQLIMRTFHTGGAVSIVQRDILSDLIDNDPLLQVNKSVLTKKYLHQEESNLVVLKPCKISINLDNYIKGKNIVINENNIWLKSLVAKIEFDDLIFSIILDYPVEIQYPELNSKEKIIELEYEKNATLLSVTAGADQMSEQVRYMARLLGGREIYKDVDHLFKKIYTLYGPLSDMDLVHLEVLLSQCLRDQEKPQQPARLGKDWKPIILNIKQVVFNTSFVQGLAFENINEAIRVGLIAEEKQDPSIIEKILTGELAGVRKK